MNASFDGGKIKMSIDILKRNHLISIRKSANGGMCTGKQDNSIVFKNTSSTKRCKLNMMNGWNTVLILIGLETIVVFAHFVKDVAQTPNINTTRLILQRHSRFR